MSSSGDIKPTSNLSATSLADNITPDKSMVSTKLDSNVANALKEIAYDAGVKLAKGMADASATKNHSHTTDISAGDANARSHITDISEGSTYSRSYVTDGNTSQTTPTASSSITVSSELANSSSPITDSGTSTNSLGIIPTCSFTEPNSLIDGFTSYLNNPSSVAEIAIAAAASGSGILPMIGVTSITGNPGMLATGALAATGICAWGVADTAYHNCLDTHYIQNDD